MSKIVGIDWAHEFTRRHGGFGHSFVIADARGRRLTPSVVHFQLRTPQRWSARKRTGCGRATASTIYSVKRFMAGVARRLREEKRSPIR